MISVIIPFEKPTPFLQETVEHLGRLTYKDFEVILLPDVGFDAAEMQKQPFPVIVRATGRVSPAIKRDIGVKQSSGEIVAFIDDDAYPDKEWLSIAVKPFSDKTVSAVGGPQLTPPDDNFRQKVSGASFISALNGKAACRYWKCHKSCYVEDWPSVNLLVRNEAYHRAGGFNTQYWPGEDTMLCLNLIRNRGKILYVPDAVVYHHRRDTFRGHLRQIGGYGLHRGHFARRYPETSFKLSYMAPSFWVLFVLFGWVLLFFPFPMKHLYISGWLIYAGAILYSVFSIYKKTGQPGISLATVPYTVATHIWYGLNFLKGFFLKKLNSRLGR